MHGSFLLFLVILLLRFWLLGIASDTAAIVTEKRSFSLELLVSYPPFLFIRWLLLKVRDEKN